MEQGWGLSFPSATGCVPYSALVGLSPVTGVSVEPGVPLPSAAWEQWLAQGLDCTPSPTLLCFVSWRSGLDHSLVGILCTMGDGAASVAPSTVS